MFKQKDETMLTLKKFVQQEAASLKYVADRFSMRMETV